MFPGQPGQGLEMNQKSLPGCEATYDPGTLPVYLQGHLGVKTRVEPTSV